MALDPESRYVLTVSGDEIVLARPDGAFEHVSVSALRRIVVATNDTGPWGSDVWWILEGDSPEDSLRYPQGATNEQAVLDRLLALPGFDHAKMIEAMSSTSNATFTCWQAPAA